MTGEPVRWCACGNSEIVHKDVKPKGEGVGGPCFLPGSSCSGFIDAPFTPEEAKREDVAEK